ncbi:hypothetical protein FSARC_2668 [Fusarium sarcochroum]|uniref:Uncharacterized protein n=1 Tax=Fusarium sarcochroum TaxID=1208366 RepID=A0A8H4XCS0_9HYPO|nr:hypothetical protein FSARC_2668 [Fusarium sarcochroum]
MHRQVTFSENGMARSTPIVGSKASKLDSETLDRADAFDTACSLQLEEGIGVEIVESTLDEFACIQFIPETPPPSDSGVDQLLTSNNSSGQSNQAREWKLPLRTSQKVKRRRVESIRSNEEAKSADNLLKDPTSQANRIPTGNLGSGNEQVRHGTPSQRATQTPESLIVTKLTPLPAGAPRIIETKGRYTIRKGVRIRDYKLPNPVPWPRAPSSSSPQYQCRDGFDRSETSLGYPQPMIAQSRQTGREETQSKQGREEVSRSPSLGTTDQN